MTIKTKFLIGFFTVFSVGVNMPVARTQEWHWRDPLNFEHVHGIKQFHNILMPVGFLGSLLFTDSKHDSKQGYGSIRPGSWFLHSRAGYYQSYQRAGRKNSKTDILEGNIGFGYYFRKWLATGMDFHATGFLDPDVRTAAVSVGPFVRWHLISYGPWTLYFEQGLSIIFIKSEFPPRGTKINFTPTYGAGISFKLFEHVYFMMSVRHYHLSNANIDGADRNPGFDANGFYIGSQFQF